MRHNLGRDRVSVGRAERRAVAQPRGSSNPDADTLDAFAGSADDVTHRTPTLAEAETTLREARVVWEQCKSEFSSVELMLAFWVCMYELRVAELEAKMRRGYSPGAARQKPARKRILNLDDGPALGATERETGR